MTNTASNNIIKIKVKASMVKHFPFDVVYIVSETLKSLLPKLFPYSICLPFNTGLIERLRHLRFQATRTISMTQNTEVTHGTVWQDGQSIEQLLDLDHVRKSFMIIPVLPRTHKKTRSKKRKDRNPSYLVATQHRAGTHESSKGRTTYVESPETLADLLVFFNDFAVLFTPRGPIRPICGACPCHLEHIQGKCSLGEMKCYQNLIVQPERRRRDEQLQTDRADHDSGPA